MSAHDRQLTRMVSMARYRVSSLGFLFLLASAGCTVTSGRLDPPNELSEERVRPGITILLTDSIGLIRGKRIGLLTNQTGVNEKGESDIDLLRGDRAKKANVSLVMLFAPEHGIRGTEDRENLSDGIDDRSRLPIISLYGRQTTAPPDSLMRQLDALVFDLQDIGTRTWTYVGAMIYSMRAAARTGKTIIVLDRPNPITGFFVEGPLLDSALANPEDPTSARAGQAYALYPTPLRHGMTMGEMALYFNEVLNIKADLKVVPMRGWRRDLWFDRTGLPWVRPSPNMPTLQSAMLYPGLVAFEGSNLSVGRGTPIAFQQIGAPWLKAAQVVALLRDRELRGARFVAEEFTPVGPTDGKYPGRRIPGVRILVTNRSALQPSRIGAALLWAIGKTSPDSLRLNERSFDLRFGAPRVRQALLRGEDPDAVIDREYRPAFEFRERTRRYLLYR
ncbi:MAG TPA: DUF1343 domain-containing protein, partial [Gemmatimonadaceae bacterium]|nr:DUF1343 domain-containing protein [Gemmatimonadaceae bacterium]